MKCSACESNLIISVGAKCDDRCSTRFTGSGERLENDGYVPYISAIGGGDYLEFSFCGNCGKIQKFEPLTEEEIRDAITGD